VEDLVCIYKSPNPVVAHLVSGILFSEGIEFATSGGWDPAYPVVGTLSEVAIYVHEGDAERARGLIEAAERGEFRIDG
jgi:hypothetical protein